MAAGSKVLLEELPTREFAAQVDAAKVYSSKDEKSTTAPIDGKGLKSARRLLVASGMRDGMFMSNERETHMIFPHVLF